jgi:acetyl esterase/lipase
MAMASTQSALVKDYWVSMTEAARANPDQTLEQVRQRVEDRWGSLSAEPGGVDYLETEVAGRPALWAIPKGSAEDRVILSLHGGRPPGQGRRGPRPAHRIPAGPGAHSSRAGGGHYRRLPVAAWPGHRCPAHGDLSGLPPTYVQVGGDETLLGESVRFGEAARAAGVDIRVDVFPGQQHTFQMAAGHVPESDDAIAGFAEWVRPRLGL